MLVRFCPNCGRETGHQRKLGFGTFFAVIITFGFWLLAIPFYPKRCSICGSSDIAPQPTPRQPPPRQLPPEQILSMRTKICPKCAESIKFAAQKCRYCGEEFNPDQVAQAVSDLQDALTTGSFCPWCGQPGVIARAVLPDGGYGPWCPHCKRPV